MIRRICLSLLACVVGVLAATNVADARGPNVIVFLADDLGYGELGCQGNKQIPTPNIDSLATNGVRFTQGYVAATYCSPSRAGLMTGKYPTRFGHEFNEGGNRQTFGLPLSQTTIADRLKALGYATCAIGKWHLGTAPQFRPTQRGFDEFYGTLANTPFFKPRLFVDSRKSPEPEVVMDEEFYTTDAYADRAVDWIDKNKDKPFFLYLPFNAQHAPLQAPKKYLDRFASIEPENRRLFAAMMSAMDDAIGRVLAKVRDLGQEENTLIFFYADNGGPTQQTTSMNNPLRGRKATTLEGGIRVPFLAQWKGKIPAHRTYENPVIQLDILPTVLAAAGATIDPAGKFDGVNLLPFLTGQSASRPHETLYWRFGNQWAIRQGDWKLVVSSIDGQTPKLFNLAEDIGEAKDQADAYPDKVKQLADAWRAWSAEQSEPLWRPDPANAKKKANKKKDGGS